MKLPFAFCLLATAGIACADQIPNRLIDYNGFKNIVVSSTKERESKRLTEKEFIQSMSEKGTVVLDARSASKFALRHVKGAINLQFTDFTAETLASVIPAKTSKILIYCNNNFEGSPVAFAGKAPAASLNLSTYTSLRAYGYTNVFELGPLLDIHTTAIPFEGAEVHN
jgi:3-mercaptopyruvate sulfurtransferase SseA